ncbi:MAG: DUF1127 domain-containing protein [Tranquillimonas sp.]|jgi:uncharacterized protein YjiS (DUF1127 family)
MTHVNYAKTFEAGLIDRSINVLKLASVRLARFRTYRQTVRELESLSDRELADLGLHRAVIHSLARQAAQQE